MKQIQIFAAALAALLVAGCRQESIRVYDVPKDSPVAAAHVHKPAPEGWTAAPRGEFRVESYLIKGTNNAKAEVSVIPLPNMGGKLLDNINRWRSAVGQKPLTEQELSSAGTPVKVGGEGGTFYEIAGNSIEKDEPSRILGAVVNRDGTGWYFKMTGDDKLVAAQKSGFLKYVEGYDFAHAGHNQGEAAAEPSATGGDPHAGLNIASAPAATEAAAPAKAWPAPAAWQQQAPGMMQDAKFSVGGGKATVTVSHAGGGLAPNILRWRGQLQMAAVSEAEAEKSASTLDLGGTQAKLVDLAGSSQRMIVVIVPQGETSAFYKLMGDSAAVAAEKDALIEFAKKVK